MVGIARCVVEKSPCDDDGCLLAFGAVCQCQDRDGDLGSVRRATQMFVSRGTLYRPIKRIHTVR